MVALIRRYALEGELKGEKRIRRLKGRVRDFWEIKAHQHRLIFFKEGQHIVITHGFVKKPMPCDQKKKIECYLIEKYTTT